MHHKWGSKPGNDEENLTIGLTLSRKEAISKFVLGYTFPDENESIIIEKQYVVKTSLVKRNTLGYFLQTFTGACSPPPGFSKVSNMLKAMQDKKLITILEKTTIESNCNQTRAYIELTGKGREYLINETNKEFVLLIAEFAVDEIIDIQINKLKDPVLKDYEVKYTILEDYTVEYTLKRINIAPFYTDITTELKSKQTRIKIYDNGYESDGSRVYSSAKPF